VRFKQALKNIWINSIASAGSQMACLSFCFFQSHFLAIEMLQEVKQTQKSYAYLSLPFFAAHLEVLAFETSTALTHKSYSEHY
jgi:hypothetical protein